MAGILNREESHISRKSVKIAPIDQEIDPPVNGFLPDGKDDEIFNVQERLRAESQSADRMRAASMKAIEIEDRILESPRIIRRQSTKEEETHWTSLWLANIMSFFIALSFTMFFPTIWPFLHEIDPSAPETFLGYIIAAYSLGQALASPVFGYWSNRIRQTKIPVAAGIVLMMLSNLLYCFTEEFSIENRKWMLMLARFLSGFGAGVVALLRAYAATASNIKDRARAISLVVAAFTLGLSVGPAINAAFAPIGYPGLVVGFFHLDMYTAAAFFSIVINIVVMFFLVLIFKEHYAGIAPASAKKNPFYALPKYDMLAASVCIFTWFIMMCALTNLETIQAPYTMIMYDWKSNQAATYNSIILAGAAFMSFVTFLAFAYKIGAIVDERKAVIVGLILVILFHVFTYPYPFFKGKLSYQLTDFNTTFPNDTTVTYGPILNFTSQPYHHIDQEHVGCDTKFEWCRTTPVVPLVVYIVIDVIFTGIGFPTINVPLSTLFSKILGPRRQGTMQGFMLQSGSFARTAGPILVMIIFTKWGPKVTWEIETGLLIVGIIPWIVFWKRMVPLKKRSQMKAGESYAYSRGRLYKF